MPLRVAPMTAEDERHMREVSPCPGPHGHGGEFQQPHTYTLQETPAACTGSPAKRTLDVSCIRCFNLKRMVGTPLCPMCMPPWGCLCPSGTPWAMHGPRMLGMGTHSDQRMHICIGTTTAAHQPRSNPAWPGLAYMCVHGVAAGPGPGARGAAAEAAGKAWSACRSTGRGRQARPTCTSMHMHIHAFHMLPCASGRAGRSFAWRGGSLPCLGNVPLG